MRTLAAALLAVATLGPPRGAAAQEPEASAAAEAGRHVAAGRRMYSELDFPGTVDAMRRALAVPGIPDATRLEALEYLGSAYVVLEQPAEARRAFSDMLALDPYHVVREPSGSPKIARFVEELRARMVDDAALDPDLELRPILPRAGRVGSDTEARFRVRGGDVASVRLFVRGIGEHDYEAIETTREGSEFVAEIPGRGAADELELYAEARDAEGRVRTRAGEPLAPLTLEIRPSGAAGQGGNLLTQWWFWAGVGVILIGGLAVGLAVGSGDNAPAGTLPPGRVELP